MAKRKTAETEVAEVTPRPSSRRLAYQISLTPAEREEIGAAAGRQPFSEWARERLLEIARGGRSG